MNQSPSARPWNGEFAYQRGACWGYQFGAVHAGVGALDGEHRQVAAFLQVDLEAGGLRLHPGDVLVAGGSIDHHPVAVLGQVDDQVVDHPALFVEHRAVERLAGFAETRHVVRQEMLQIGRGLLAGDVDHGHVGHVEDAAVTPNLMVLLDLRTVVQRHVPTAEIDHLGAERDVQLVKRVRNPMGILLPGVAGAVGRDRRHEIARIVAASPGAGHHGSVPRSVHRPYDLHGYWAQRSE